MLSPNPTSRIVPKNPLADEPCDTHLRKVEQFAEEKGLIKFVDTLKKGAIRVSVPSQMLFTIMINTSPTSCKKPGY